MKWDQVAQGLAPSRRVLAAPFGRASNCCCVIFRIVAYRLRWADLSGNATTLYHTITE